MISRPAYASLEPDLLAPRHILVIEGETLSLAHQASLVAAFGAVEGDLHTLLVSAGKVAAPVGASLHYFDTATMLGALHGLLADATVNLRIYALGTEPFVWSVARTAVDRGIDWAQIRLSHAGSLCRKVWCTHCHQFTDGVTSRLVPCAGCARYLFVRDHFSRRLGAFMGVQVDAEAPGSVPERREVFQ